MRQKLHFDFYGIVAVPLVILSVSFFSFLPSALAEQVVEKQSVSSNCDKVGEKLEGIVEPPCWCSRARTKVEKMICNSDKELWLLDRLVGAYYEFYVIPDQLRWLRNVRNKCKDVKCLRNVYQERIATMEKKSKRRRVSP